MEITGLTASVRSTLSTGYEQRRYQAHWHSYGEILLVGSGQTNIFMVNQQTYELAKGDFLLIWPTGR